MWDKIKFAIGMLWASPVTLAVFLYVLPLWILRYYKYAGWTGLAWRWNYIPSKRGFLSGLLAKRWMRWNGHAGGNIIVMRKRADKSRESITLIHEHEHVVQVMRLGIFQPIHYGLNWFVAKFALRHADPYFDNLYEIDARRGANQLIDIPGAVKRIKEAKEKNKDGAK